MRYLLNVCYVLLLVALSPLIVYAAIRKGKYREGLRQKLLGFVPVLPAATNKRIWFHAVSVGEVNLLMPILEKLRAASPNVEVVVSSTTKTGYGLAKQRFPNDTVCYCPLDFSWAVETAFKRIKPNLLVLVELELWPNLLTTAKRNEIPVAIVNGRLSDKSTRGYLRLGSVMRDWAQCISAVGAQSRSCAERFVKLGVPSDRVTCTGSIKFDGAKTDRKNEATQRIQQLANLSRSSGCQPEIRPQVFVAGSTQAPEEEYALKTYLKLRPKYPDLRLILVPRHPERGDEVARLLEQSNVSWARRTLINETNPITDEKVLLVDTVGELAGCWGCADVGFVGGSMGNRGGQNMLEPAGFGVATCFGPNTRNFRDVVELLISADAAEVVKDGDSLTEFVDRCLADTEFRVELGRRAQQVVLSQRGATDATILLLQGLLHGEDVEFSEHFVDEPDNFAVLRYPNASSSEGRRSA